jgi:hypothetical protein
MYKDLEVKKLIEQRITVDKDCGFVDGCYRKVVFTNFGGGEDFDITLTGGDALIPLEVGQRVMADLRCDHYWINGEWKDEYYIMSIKPLEMNVKIEFVEDWTTHLV